MKWKTIKLFCFVLLAIKGMKFKEETGLKKKLDKMCKIKEMFFFVLLKKKLKKNEALETWYAVLFFCLLYIWMHKEQPFN